MITVISRCSMLLLQAIGHRVMTICPRYDQYKDAWDTEVLAKVKFSDCSYLYCAHIPWKMFRRLLFILQIKVGDRMETVRFYHCYKRGVDRVFVDHPMFLEKVSYRLSIVGLTIEIESVIISLAEPIFMV